MEKQTIPQDKIDPLDVFNTKEYNGQYEPRHEETGFLHMRKQRCRSAVQ